MGGILLQGLLFNPMKKAEEKNKVEAMEYMNQPQLPVKI